MKAGGRITSFVNKPAFGGVSSVVPCLNIAPGSGLNGVCGGALEAIETVRDQFVDGGRFVGRMRTFGSGLNCVGGLGGGPGLMTWLGLRRSKLFVSAARPGATSRRQMKIWHSSTRLCSNGTAARKVFSAPEIKRFVNRVEGDSGDEKGVGWVGSVESGEVQWLDPRDWDPARRKSNWCNSILNR